MSGSWPLLSPRIAPGPPSWQEPSEFVAPVDRLSAPARYAHLDYHNFIETLSKASPLPLDAPREMPSAPRTKKTRFLVEHNEPPRPRRSRSRRSKPLPVGTTRLFDHGRWRLIPTPSDDPQDPLNLPPWRKWTAIVALSVSAALAVATGSAVGDLLRPVFFLAYGGVDSHVLTKANFASSSILSVAVNSTAPLVPLLPPTTVPPSVAQNDLLATLPLLTAAASGYVLLPLSEAVGRRPVLLLAMACAWAGALWAGLSSGPVQSLAVAPAQWRRHLAARALAGIGAGAAQGLVPLVAAHDLVFAHQRHAALAVVVAIQGIVVAAVSAAAPALAVARGVTASDGVYVYYLLAGIGGLAWLVLLVLLPETRGPARTRAALSGASVQRPLRPANESRSGVLAILDAFLVLPVPLQTRRASACLCAFVQTALLPPVLWVAALSTVLFVAQRAMTQLTVAAMLSSRQTFAVTGAGAVGVPLGTAGLLAGLLGGPGAGWLSLAVTRHLQTQRKRRNSLRQSMLLGQDRSSMDKGTKIPPRQPTVRREAEHNLAVLVLPLVLGTTGFFLFGGFGSASAPDPTRSSERPVWPAFAGAAFLVDLALLLVLSGGSVFLIESFPSWAGACLAHAHCLRLVVAFFLDGRTNSELIATQGYIDAWAVYAEVLLVLSLGLPALLFSGRRLRRWTAGTVAEEVVEMEGSKNEDEKTSSGGQRPGVAETPDIEAATTVTRIRNPNSGERQPEPPASSAVPDGALSPQSVTSSDNSTSTFNFPSPPGAALGRKSIIVVTGQAL